MEECVMKTRHALALIVSAFCLMFAIMCTVSFILHCIDLANVSPNDTYGYVELTMLFGRLYVHFVWDIGAANATFGAILPLSAIKKYGKGVTALSISLSAINAALLIALVVLMFWVFKF